MPRATEELKDVMVGLLYERGFAQSEIAARLDVDPSGISKRVTRAVDLGWFERVPPVRALRDRIPTDLLRAAQDALDLSLPALRLQEGLRGAYGGAVRVTVVAGPSRRKAKEGWDARAAAVGRRAGERLVEALHDPAIRVVGIVWGVTMRALVDRVTEMSSDAKTKDLVVVPLGGEPLLAGQTYPGALTSAVLAADLATACGADQSRQVQMPPIPAFIPARRPREVKAIRGFIEEYQGYRRIFGPGGLVGEIQALLTSAAGLDLAYLSDPWLNALLDAGNLDLKALAGLMVGNVAGLVLPRPGLGRADLRRVEELNERHMGLTLSQLEACAKRCASNGDPGVVLAAHGDSKTQTIVEALRRRMVNELVLDDELAESLADHLKLDWKGTAPPVR